MTSIRAPWLHLTPWNLLQRGVARADASDPLQPYHLKLRAQVIAGGARLFDQRGRRYREKDLRGAPASLETARLICWRATLSPTRATLQLT